MIASISVEGIDAFGDMPHLLMPKSDSPIPVNECAIAGHKLEDTKVDLDRLSGKPQYFFSELGESLVFKSI